MQKIDCKRNHGKFALKAVVFTFFCVLPMLVLGQDAFSIFGGKETVIPASTNQQEVAVESSLEDFLTQEEKDFMAKGLLPPYYPSLRAAAKGPGGIKAAQALGRARYPKGKETDFTTNFGNPDSMLNWARDYKDDEKILPFLKSMRAGDVLIMGPRAPETVKTQFVCIMTKGPWNHALICVDGPPGVFIEAIGVTGAKNDATVNKVRYNPWFDVINGWGTYRLLRPSAGMSDAESQSIIAKAVAYSEAQLGKPYDYAFSDSDGTQSFYCSELVYKAFRDGAGATSVVPDKSADRDQIVIALHAFLDGLAPKDPYKLSDSVVHFAMDFTEERPPNINKLIDFIVDDIASNCTVFEKAFPTLEAREKLRTVLGKVRDNKAFPNFLKTQTEYAQKKASGAFVKGWGLGKFNEIKADVEVGVALAKDFKALADESGAGTMQMCQLLGKIIAPLYSNLGTYGNFLTGMNRENALAMPEGIKTVLGMVDWAVAKREQVKSIPIIGEGLGNLLPGNGDGKVRTDFTSPTDLAEISPKFSMDYP